jgi:hypothetical protein
MRNLITGILIGMLIGIGAVAADNLLLEYATSYELPKSDYHYEESEKKPKVWEARLWHGSTPPMPPGFDPF